MGLEAKLEKSDILSLFNIVWNKSFGRKRTNTKAIRDRGWNPANHRLLTDPGIIKTRMATSVTPPHSNELALSPEANSTIAPFAPDTSTDLTLNSSPFTARVEIPTMIQLPP